MTTDKLRILSFGAGAVGTYIGGSLLLQGHEVVFIERPVTADYLRQHGLSLNLLGTEHHLPRPTIVEDVAAALETGPFEAALFALKSFDTAAVVESLVSYKKQLPPILCLQNGVDNEEIIAAGLGHKRLIPGTLTSAIGRRGIGSIQLERLRGIGVAAGHPLSERLASALSEAGLNARLYPNAADMKWSKMLTNLVGNASSAILDMPPGDIFAHRELFEIEIQQLREILAVMQAQGIQVVDLPGTPVRLLAFAVRRLPAVLARPLLSKAIGGGRGGKMPSFHIDLHSQRGSSEVDYLNGAVVRAGEKTGVPTPANRFLNNTLLALVNEKMPVRTFARDPEALLRQWKLATQSV